MIGFQLELHDADSVKGLADPSMKCSCTESNFFLPRISKSFCLLGCLWFWITVASYYTYLCTLRAAARRLSWTSCQTAERRDLADFTCVCTLLAAVLQLTNLSGCGASLLFISADSHNFCNLQAAILLLALTSCLVEARWELASEDYTFSCTLLAA